MSRFVFRLDRLLEIRQRQEDLLVERQARLELALRGERNSLAAMEVQRREHHAQLDELKLNRVAVDELLHLCRFVADLDARIERQRERVVAAEERAREARAELTQARMETKALDKLRQRKHDAWRLEEQRRDDRDLDEMATQRFLRNGTGP